MLGYAVLAAIWIVAIYGIFRQDYISVNILFVFVMFQNFILALISGQISKNVYNLIILTKELYVALVIVYALILRKRMSFTKFDAGCCLCILTLLVMIIVDSKGSTMSILSSFRQMYLPFMFYLMGRSLNLSYKGVRKVTNFFVRLSLTAVIFGLIEWITGDFIWAHIGIADYYQYKGYSRYVYGNRVLHAGVYSFDLYPLVVLRRMISFIIDPVILGQILSAALIIIMFDKNIIKPKARRYTYICFLCIGLLLTFTKGGILISGVAFVILVGKIWNNKFLSKLSFTVALLLGFLFIGFAIKNNQSTMNHIRGLIDGISVLRKNIFGVGIGGYGNLSDMYGETIVEGSGESFVGTLVAQTGVIGIFMYGYFYLELFSGLKRKGDELSTIVLWLNAAMLVAAFFGNSVIGFMSCSIYYILAGCCLSYEKDIIMLLVSKIKNGSSITTMNICTTVHCRSKINHESNT